MFVLLVHVGFEMNIPQRTIWECKTSKLQQKHILNQKRNCSPAKRNSLMSMQERSYLIGLNRIESIGHWIRLHWTIDNCSSMMGFDKESHMLSRCYYCMCCNVNHRVQCRVCKSGRLLCCFLGIHRILSRYSQSIHRSSWNILKHCMICIRSWKYLHKISTGGLHLWMLR